MNDCIKIVLQQTVPGDYIPPINKEGGPVVRSIYMPIVDAYLYNNVVNVSFNGDIAVVNVTITNESPVKPSIRKHTAVLLPSI